MDLALYEGTLGATLADHDLAAAFDWLQRAIAAFPTDNGLDLGSLESFAHCALADVLARSGKPDDARREAGSGLGMVHGDAFEDRMHLQMCRALVARADAALGDRTAASTLLDTTLADLQKLAVERPGRSAR